MNNIKNALEHLYLTFGKYTTEGMTHCDCGCIDKENVKKLNSRPLRELEMDDLVSYHGSALYTWGELEHYKHYLPRFFELMSRNRNFSMIDLYDISVKLEYAKWTEWEADEVDAIKEYVLQDWIEFANNDESEIRDTILESYCSFFELKDLLKLWDVSNGSKAVRNFVLFFYFHGNQILDGRAKTKGTRNKEEFTSLVSSIKLLENLETEFFKHEKTDPEYAEKISVVLQMIEQQLKADKIKT